MNEDGSCDVCDNGLRSCTCRCIKCGQFYSMEHTTREDDGRCFSCWFWHNRWTLHMTSPDKSFIVKGTAYFVGEEPKPGDRGFRGFGGSEFRIQPHDDSDLIISHNVWCQGDVPSNFADLLRDNADFVPKPCSHEWRERGDERTANFSVTCIHCGADGLI